MDDPDFDGGRVEELYVAYMLSTRPAEGRTPNEHPDADHSHDHSETCAENFAANVRREAARLKTADITYSITGPHPCTCDVAECKKFEAQIHCSEHPDSPLQVRFDQTTLMMSCVACGPKSQPIAIVQPEHELRILGATREPRVQNDTDDADEPAPEVLYGSTHGQPSGEWISVPLDAGGEPVSGRGFFPHWWTKRPPGPVSEWKGYGS